MNDRSMVQDIHEFIRHLLSAVAAAGLYSLNHPQVERLVDVTMGSLSRALAVRPDIAILEVDGELVIDGEPQPFSLVLVRFAEVLKKCGIGHLRFLDGVTRPELITFVAALARQDGNELASCQAIRLGQLEMPESGNQSAASGAGGDGSSGSFSREALAAAELERLLEVYEAVKRNERLKPSGIAETVSELVDAFNSEGEALLAMAALREQDEYTFTHASNVCILTMAQALSLGIQGQQLNDLGMAAMLHDIGKMFVSEEILCKPGKLNDEEFEIMKRHPVKGARFLLETPGVPRLAAIVAYEHHMRDDLSGYPVAPAGWQLNLASQMTAIADMYDAMRTRRPYSEPRSPQVILNVLQTLAGTHFNPHLVNNFTTIIQNLKDVGNDQ